MCSPFTFLWLALNGHFSRQSENPAWLPQRFPPPEEPQTQPAQAVADVPGPPNEDREALLGQVEKLVDQFSDRAFTLDQLKPMYEEATGSPLTVHARGLKKFVRDLTQRGRVVSFQVNNNVILAEAVCLSCLVSICFV